MAAWDTETMRKVVGGHRLQRREHFCKLEDRVSISIPLLSFLLFSVLEGELAYLRIIIRMETRPQSQTSTQSLQMTVVIIMAIGPKLTFICISF